MKLPVFTAVEVANALELCGYGPAAAEGKRALHVRARGMDFHLTFTKEGMLEGFAPAFADYQNPLNPLVRALLSTIRRVFCEMADYPWLEGVLEETFETSKFLCTTTYLWMVDPQNGTPLRWVLNEFYIHGVPVWHQVRTMEYHNLVYENFYQHIGEMLLEFKENGKLPEGVKPEELNSLIQECVPERSV